MFAEQPYDDVTIQDIAARAGVPRALMHHYFSTKRDVYAALFERASDRFLARVSPDPRLPLAQQLAPRSRATSNPLSITPSKRSRSTGVHCRMTRQSGQSSLNSSTSWANF
jgi:AcrR family transcriptional regulator